MLRTRTLGLLPLVSAILGCSFVTSLDALEGTGAVDAATIDAASDGAAPLDAGADVVQVPPSSATDLDVGGQQSTEPNGHACVVAGPERSVFCWGAGIHGQLGDGASKDRSTATKILGGSSAFNGVDAITLGSWNTCARRGPTVQCWGQRQMGTVGDGQVTSVPQATPSNGNNTFSLLSVGGATACAVKNGELVCWGNGSNEQIGVNAATLATCPSFVTANGRCSATLTKAAQITTAPVGVSVGKFHVCILTATDAVWCWGSNSATGIEGTIVPANQWTPVTVKTAPTTTLTSIAQLSSHGDHNCVLRKDKSVACWGPNDTGQIGQPVGVYSTYAVTVAGLTATQVAVGDHASCAVTATKEVQCWGDDTFGQLGDGTKTATGTPVFVKGPGGVGKLGDVTKVAVAWGFACALTADKSVYCWGHNDHGQLGDGSTTDRAYPVRVLGIP